MSNSYNPRNFEFVARMGRIVLPEDKPDDLVPIPFHIPQVPKDLEPRPNGEHEVSDMEVIQGRLGRNMRAAPVGSRVTTVNSTLHDVRPGSSMSSTLGDTDRSRKRQQLENIKRNREMIQQEEAKKQLARKSVNDVVLFKEGESLHFTAETSGRLNTDLPISKEELLNYVQEEIHRLHGE